MSHGVVHFRVAGPADSEAPPVLFVHPFLMDGSLWSGVADLLAAQGIRSYAPDWPLGAPLDVGAADLALETFLPADEDSAALLRELAATRTAPRHPGGAAGPTAWR